MNGEMRLAACRIANGCKGELMWKPGPEGSGIGDARIILRERNGCYAGVIGPFRKVTQQQAREQLYWRRI